MGKKLIGIAVIVMMLFGVFGLTGCDNVSLADYKETKITELQAYADAKSAGGNYSEDGLAAICKAVIDGKAAISEATTKPAVDTAVDTAKAEIDDVPRKSENSIAFEEVSLGGSFIILNGDKLTQAIIANKEELITFFENHEIAWENGVPLWEHYSDDFFEESALLLYFAVTPSISVSYVLYDISMTSGSLVLHIGAQIYGDTLLDAEGIMSFVIEVRKSDINGAEEFNTDIKGKNLSQEEKKMEKHPNSDNGIDATLEKQIRQSFLELRADSDLGLDNIFVGKYYGTYNGASAVMMLVSGEGIGDAEWTETVAGVTFSQSSWTPIQVWRDGVFYTLAQAYENGFYSMENLTAILESLTAN